MGSKYMAGPHSSVGKPLVCCGRARRVGSAALDRRGMKLQGSAPATPLLPRPPPPATAGPHLAVTPPLSHTAPPPRAAGSLNVGPQPAAGMASARPATPPPGGGGEVDISQVLLDARTRWLKPAEVCNILLKADIYGFQLNLEPPTKPPGGSLYLFDRKLVRYFRKDGHNWRKKKDGKTVREAHEKLKAGSVDILHCYYAHSEEDDHFQRRCYWLLDGKNENLVLVHYRHVPDFQSRTAAATPSPKGSTPTSPATISPLSDAAAPSPTSRPDSPEDSPSVSLERSTSQESELSSSSYQHGSCAAGCQQLPPAPTAEVEEDGMDEGVSPEPPTLLLRRQPSSLLEQQLRQVLPLQAFRPPSNQQLGEAGVPPAAAGMVEPSRQGWKQGPGQKQGLLPGSVFKSPAMQDSAANHTSSNKRQWQQLPPVKQESDPPSSSILTLKDSSRAPAGQAWAISDSDAVPQEPLMRLNVTSCGAYWSGPEASSELGGLPFSTMQDLMPEQGLMEASQSSFFTWPPLLGDSPDGPSEGWPSAQLSVESDSSFATRVGLSDSAQTQVPDASAMMSNQMPPEGAQAATEQQEMLEGQVDDGAGDVSVADILEEVHDDNDDGFSQRHPLAHFSKLDSFGQWVNEHYQADERGSAERMRSTSGSPLRDTPEDITPASSEEGDVPAERGYSEDGSEPPGSTAVNMQVEQAAHAPAYAEKQLFNITDYCPSSSHTGEDRTVVMTGQMLDAVGAAPVSRAWFCRFGLDEVPAELLQDGCSLRCQAPPQAAVGCVALCVTCGDGRAVSQVVTFEYLSERTRKTAEANIASALASGVITDSEALQLRLLRMVLGGSEEDGAWDWLDTLLQGSGRRLCQEPDVVQEQMWKLLLRQELHNWVKTDATAAGRLDKGGQCSLHLAAALGYEWAIPVLLSSCSDVDVKDRDGRTPLHWAAAHGRERVVVTLLAAGAAPALLAGPPSLEQPRGQTPADLAAAGGHEGIAAYLAEMALNRSLSNMTLRDSASRSAAVAAGDAAVAAAKAGASSSESRQELEASLRAVRNAAEAAALIQEAYKQENGGELAMQLAEQQIKALAAARRIQTAYRGHRQQKVHRQKLQHTAATRIQRRYRGWRGRRDFLQLRQRIIRLQARVKGKLQREKYQKIQWSVGVLQKAIIRWRQRRPLQLTGQEGFGAEAADSHVGGAAATTPEEAWREAGGPNADAALEAAVTRVQAIVRSKQARAQYDRMRHAHVEAQVEYKRSGSGALGSRNSRSTAGHVGEG
eukprot:SM000191S05220  [mRNA]  locus=s191:221872:227911:+ [translate_table: standard]